MRRMQWKRTLRSVGALLLGTVLVMTNISTVSRAEEQETIGYSAAMVEEKDMSKIVTYTSYRKMSDEEKKKVTEIKIGVAQELYDFSNDFNDFYKVNNGYENVTIYLENDIRMSDLVSMAPIGYYNSDKDYKPFKGTFDGQGHEVYVLINDTKLNGVGFFGAVAVGTIQNLILSGSVTGAKNQVGGIIGCIKGDVTVANCYNKANITSTYTTGGYVGGIVGFINGGTTHAITHCSNEGNIKAVQNVGGIVGGVNSATDISYCRNIGEVKAADWAVESIQTDSGCGGIAGILKNNPTSVSNCVNNGTIRTWGCTAAGIAGNIQIEGCALSKVYNYGTVTNTGSGGYANAIYGSSTGISGLLNNEMNVVNSTEPEKENEEITSAAVAADTSIVSVTKDIVGYSDARVIRKDLTKVTSFTDYQASTNKTDISEIKISTADEMSQFLSNCATNSGYAGLTVYLANDINMTGTSMTAGGKSSVPFQGTFDGQGFELTGISITASDAGCGLFKYAASGAVIRNLILNGSISTDKGQAGSLVGNVNAGAVTIENCYNKASITGKNAYVGGFVGNVSNNDGVSVTVSHCTNTGAVQALSDVGGIVGGALYTTTVTNCRNAGTITATDGTENKNGCGSIVGTIKNKTTTISDCIHNGTVNSGSCATNDENGYGYKASGTAKVSAMQNISASEDTTYEVAVTYADTLIGGNAGQNRKSVSSITKDIVGYSDARVEYVDLSTVLDFTTYKGVTDKTGVQQIKICTGEELCAFRTYFSDTAKAFDSNMTVYLANDIDMKDITMAPIGTKDIIFQGTFDGQGYEISNFTINKENSNRALFGYVQNATIRNVVLSGSISGGAQAGGLVSHVKAGTVTIENCYNKAAVTSSDAYAAGIAALVANNEGVSLKVSNCTNTGAIQAQSNVGGIVGGALYTTEIINCRNIATVTTTDGSVAHGCGGLTGIVKNQPLTISHSVNNGEVNAGACTGAGILGAIEKVKGCSISETTNYGTVTVGETGKAYAVYGMVTGAHVKEDVFATFDKAGTTDSTKDLAVEEGKKHIGWLPGDANGDEVVDVRDIVRIKRYEAKEDGITIINESCADTNRDNQITGDDTAACRKLLAEMEFYEKQLEGLSVLALGDSYFAGAGLPQDHIWLHMLANKYQMDIRNYGIGGSTVSYTADSSGNYHDPMTERYQELFESGITPDIILVEGGRNDFNYNATVGSLSLENKDKMTYAGALNLIIDAMQEKYPKAMIICITPWNFPDKEGCTNHYTDYCYAMVGIAELQGVKCIQAYDPEVSGIDMQKEGFSATYTVDNGVSHLNLEGMKIVMPRFEKLIAEYWEEFNHAK